MPSVRASLLERMVGFRGVSILVAALLMSLLCAPIALAADKNIVELQTDVASLEDQVRTLQTTVNSLLGAQEALLRQTLDRVNQIHTENAVTANAVADQVDQQAQKLATPVAALNAKLDQLISQCSATQDNLADVNSRLGRLEQRIVDLENAVKVIQVPPAPPPSDPQAQNGAPSGAGLQRGPRESEVR